MSVIVDDQDPAVVYNPSTGWTAKGHPEEYNQTDTVSTTPGNTATFSFEGSSISVYATVGPSKGQGASMSFSLDEVPQTPFTAPGSTTSTTHHQLLWASGPLSESSHTLVITQNSQEEQIFLDYFLYNTTSTSGKSLFIDDSDLGVNYSTGWETQGSEEYFQQVARTCQGDQCSLSLTFEGDSFSIFGDVLPGDSVPGNTFNSSVVIDGGAPLPITQPVQPAATAAPVYNIQLFNAQQLGDGSHTATFNTHSSDGFLVDYFLVTTEPDGTSASTSASTVPSASISIPPSAGTSAPGDSPGQVSRIGGTSKPFPIAAAVGGVVGGLAILVIILVSALLWRRRSRRFARPSSVHGSLHPYLPEPPPAYRKFAPPEARVLISPRPLSKHSL